MLDLLLGWLIAPFDYAFSGASASRAWSSSPSAGPGGRLAGAATVATTPGGDAMRPPSATLTCTILDAGRFRGADPVQIAASRVIIRGFLVMLYPRFSVERAAAWHTAHIGTARKGRATSP